MCWRCSSDEKKVVRFRSVFRTTTAPANVTMVQTASNNNFNQKYHLFARWQRHRLSRGEAPSVVVLSASSQLSSRRSLPSELSWLYFISLLMDMMAQSGFCR